MSNWWNAPSEEDLQQKCSSKDREKILETSITAANFRFVNVNDISVLDELTNATVVSLA